MDKLLGILAVILLMCGGCYDQRASNFPQPQVISPVVKANSDEQTSSEPVLLAVAGESDLLVIEIEKAKQGLETWKAANPEPPMPLNEPHLFVDSSGQFTTRATVTAVSHERVEMTKTDGGSVTLAMDKLSDYDQQYVQEKFGDYLKIMEPWLAEHERLEKLVREARQLLETRKQQRLDEMDQRAAESERRRKASIAADLKIYEESKTPGNGTRVGRIRLTPGEFKYVDDDAYGEVFGFRTLGGLEAYWNGDSDPDPSFTMRQSLGIVPIPIKTRVRVISIHKIADGISAFKVATPTGNQLFVVEMDLFDERDP